MKNVKNISSASKVSASSSLQNGVADQSEGLAADGLGAIQEILFGQQVRAGNEQVAELRRSSEERISQLADGLNERISELTKNMNSSLEEVRQQLSAQKKDQSKALMTTRDELTQQLENALAKLENKKLDRENLSQMFLTVANELSSGSQSSSTKH